MPKIFSSLHVSKSIFYGFSLAILMSGTASAAALSDPAANLANMLAAPSMAAETEGVTKDMLLAALCASLMFMSLGSVALTKVLGRDYSNGQRSYMNG
ncbi:MAG: hypothetical protein AAGI92_02300 [Pseudomonadota bacterium]